MYTFTLQHRLGECSLYLGEGVACTQALAEQWFDAYRDHQCVIITDDNVGAQWAKSLQSIYQPFFQTCHVLSFPQGELSKNRETKALLEDQMIQLGCSRQTVVIALGGGVVLDMAGFIAATYMRGVPCFYLPTSLLAMVDASIGGKTAVNTPHGKNLMGTFTQPQAVCIDVAFLSTLPIEEQWQGWVEMVKHALIMDESLLSDLEAIARSLQQDETITDSAWLQAIMHSVRIKCRVVEADECERGGLRQILNFGHTVAHAIEAVSDYAISHGEAVCVGLWVESYLSYRWHGLSQEHWEQIQRVLTLVPFSSTHAWHDERWLQCVERMRSDKKSVNQDIRCVLLTALGVVESVDNHWAVSITKEQMANALRAYAKESLCCHVSS